MELLSKGQSMEHELTCSFAYEGVNQLQGSQNKPGIDLRKQISFSPQTRGLRDNDKPASQKETAENTLEMGLESKMSQESFQEPKIQITQECSEMEKYRKYQKVLIKSFSKTHPPISEDSSLKKVEIEILDVEQQEIPDKKRKVRKPPQNKENQAIESKPHKLTKPEIIQSKKFSLQFSGQSDFLILETDSMIMNSANSHEESVTHQIDFPCKARSSDESDKNQKKNIKRTMESKQKAGICVEKVHEEQHFHPKSQKKVTFIGDSSMRIEEDEVSEKERQKIETFNSIKDDSSTTSILNLPSHQKKRSKIQQSSRKIISQDENYCLFRIIGFRKSEKHLMCRSVQIKEDTTQYKQLKLYLLCRENQHHNIVKMHSYQKVVRDNNKYFVEIKMDYYPKNLEEYILESKKLEKRANIERKIILFQILKALNFVHSKGICHRDLNPHSILIGDQLEVAITNFAFVKDSTNLYSSDNFYESNFFIRPPEVILQPSRLFQKGGDIWSFGCIIVYMLKGQMPFFKSSDSQLMIEIIKLLGPPDKQYLQQLNFKDTKRFIFPKTSKKAMNNSFRCQDPELLSLLSRIFIYRAQARPSASALMSSSYFSDIKEEYTFKMLMKSYEISTLFDFKPNQLDEKTRKEVVPAWYIENNQ